MKITLDKVVAGAEGSLGGRDPGLSGIPAFEGCSLLLALIVTVNVSIIHIKIHNC